MNCYILSLKKDTDRRRSIELQFSLNNDSYYEFFYAIDYHNIQNYYDINSLKAKSQLTVGEICCACSHLKIYEKALYTSNESVVVLEDDAHIHEPISPKYPILKELHEIFDVIILGYSKCDLRLAHRMKYIRPGLKVYHSDNFVRFPYKQWKCGTVAYSISSDGMRKILEINKNLEFSSDNWQEFEKKGVRIAHYSNIFITEKFNDFDSNLELDRNTYRNPSYILRYIAGTVRHFTLLYRFLELKKILKY